MPRIQLKLTAALAGLVLSVVLVSGVLAERGLRRRELARIAASLESRAGLVREVAGQTDFRRERAPELDALADRVAGPAGARVTLIDAEGTVLGDSDVPVARIPSVESHADRPEVREALSGRVGTSSRRSETVGRRLFYLAVPAANGGAVRLAVELSDLERAVADLRSVLFVAGVAGLLAAFALSYPISWLALRPLRELRGMAASVARGDSRPHLRLRTRDEIGEIARAIDQMADQLRQRLGDATREKELLRAVLDGMVEGVLVIDSRGEIILANERLRDFYGVRSEIAGRTPLAALRDAALDEILRRAARTDEPVSREIPAGPRGGRTLAVHAVRFPSGPGARIGTVAVLHDVTEAARIEKMRRDFVANASHELRTPLAAVRGFAETLLGGGPLSERDRRSYLEIIDRHSRRLGHLVDDLLELSRIEGGKADLQLTRVDVAGLAESWLRDSASQISERKLEVSHAVEGSPLAWADRRALEQVFGNLLENAIRYTDPGGRIEVRIAGDGEFVELQVRDSGIGIPEADLDRIFERFYRVDKARSRALGGTGLGLSIVKHLVQNMGGSVSVESELGRGSVFTVRLPGAP